MLATKILDVSSQESKFRTYKIKVKFTLEDLPDIPEQAKEKLMGRSFIIDNIISHKGFWFRPAFHRYWDNFKEVIEPPPSVVGK